MFIPDPSFFNPRSWVKKMPPDPHQRIWVFKPKKLFLSSRKYDPGCSTCSGSGSWFFTHPGSRGQKGTRSWIRPLDLVRERIRTSDAYLSCVVRCAHDRLRLPQREDRDERRRSGDQREVPRAAWHGKLRRQVGHFRDKRRAFWDGWGHLEAVLRIRIRSIRMFFWVIRIHKYELRIRLRILLSSSKNGKKKPLIPTVLWLLYDFLSLTNEVNVPSKRKI